MKKEKIDYDAITAIIVTLFGLIYTLFTYLLPRAVIGNKMGPIYFPLVLGIMLIIIGVILFIRSDKSKIKVAIALMRNQSQKEKEVSRMVWLTCLTAIAYALIFEHVGFVLATFLFMMSVLFITNGKKYLVNTLVSIIFSVSIFAIFNYALGIPLPGLPF